MKKTIFRKTVALLLVTILAVLASCGGNGQGTETDSAFPQSEETTTAPSPNGLLLAANGATSYQIVYPEGASSVVMNAVMKLKNAFSDGYGVSISYGDDYLKKGETPDEGALEILVGKTNRPASSAIYETLQYGDYTVAAVGKQLVILGYNEEGTAKAISELIARLFTEQRTTLSFTEADSFRLTSEGQIMISFYGDSITTYTGYSNAIDYNATLAENPVWYSSSKMAVTSTWWYRVLTEMDWDLCVNNSYSGGRVSHPYSYETRAVNLHTDSGVMPDVIVIYYGINDYNNKVELSLFSSTYDTMLRNMKAAYPNAQIYCCTLNPIICTDNGRNTSLEQNGAGVAITAFNSAIVRLADANGARVIDFYTTIGSTLYQHTYDNIHPNADGMKLMSDVVTEHLKSDYS